MTNIFVAKLDYGVTQEDLKSAFEQFGRVNKVSIAMDKETGRSKGFAFIEMQNESEAAEAIQSLDGSTMNGRQIAVKQAEDRSNNRNDQQNRPANSYEKKEFKPYDKKPAYTPPSDADSRTEHVSDVKPDFIPFIPDSVKGEQRKKDLPKKKEKNKDLSDGRPRPHKMEAYKKSGKNNRFFDLDDDDY